jgi:predicted enzyme related to lactoylglutathione lyase
MLQSYPLFSYIPVKDTARARQFYEQTLGLKSGQGFPGGIIYELGRGTALFKYESANAGTSRASLAYWEVLDFDREIAELKARGVAFEALDGPVGGARAAQFKDSEGNILAVVQDPRPQDVARPRRAAKRKKARKASRRKSRR